MRLPIPFGNPYTYTGHSGVDFPQMRGTPFRASGPGTVSSIDYSPRAGHTVWVRYDNGPNVGYCHMDYRTSNVRVGQRVSEGTILGLVGSLGLASTGPHLHVEVAGHATTAGFWKFFDRNRVVGQGSSAGEQQQQPFEARKEDEMLMLKIVAGGTTHLAALGEGTFKHFKSGEPIERIATASGSTWHEIDIRELSAFLATYGCDTAIWDFRDAGGNSVPFAARGAQFVVVDPITGMASSGNTWTATGAIRAGQSRAVALTDAQIKAIAAAVAEQIGTPDVQIDYDRIANTVREKFSSSPLK